MNYTKKKEKLDFLDLKKAEESAPISNLWKGGMP